MRMRTVRTVRPVFSAAASLEVAAMWIVRVRARPRHGSTAQPSRSA